MAMGRVGSLVGLVPRDGDELDGDVSALKSLEGD